jgi:hypothetical protein
LIAVLRCRIGFGLIAVLHCRIGFGLIAVLHCPDPLIVATVGGAPQGRSFVASLRDFAALNP